MIPRVLRRVLGFADRLRRSERGSIALKFAMIGPAVMLLGVGGIDLMAVHTAKGRLQSIADAAALAGAPALALATDGSAARERADAFVRGQMEEWAEAPTYEASYEILDRGGQRAIRVLLRGHRTSFFANMLPPGGWNFVGDATASTAGLTPLCVLISGSNGAKLLNIKDAGQMKAPACLVHSNRDILVEGGNISAASVQAVTTAGGSISPSASTGAAPIADPFADLDLERQGPLGLLCTVVEMANRVKVSSGTHHVPAGRHCGGIEASGTARVLLAPGEHFFLKGSLVVKEDGRLEGEDVALFFDTASKFDFTDRAQVNLDGRKTGPYAGIVMGAMRDNRQDFIISADHVESLLGVIYVPSARLIVDGTADVARDSAWTVIVAKEMQMKGSPSLFINADYDATDVPVPAGVGPRGGARLIE
ncbi:TadE/TadG family type IV pilus assembly protein [Brevundimonas viscosa]|uniref:Putative Flp pilus-assembly TadE/G-like n=1 Tax=Brevundimonas viscosa TaxID=871741 RepID=A0A1I6TGP1_9CAUL|nr:pilus assembly protein TadG-related protein [Brevundimonas viscosa]SFS88298.1 Putative Flp pilus-assembly TadE/G-like [Brevundimonas viscosa]